MPRCMLCGAHVGGADGHFDTCFERHCPVSPPVAAPLSRPPMLFWMGRVPPEPALLVRNYLALPERLALACGSWHAKMLCDDEEAWDQYASTLWASLWAAVPDGTCGCRFASPQHVRSIDPKTKALVLWKIDSITTLQIRVKTMCQDYRSLSVGPHTSVAELKDLMEIRTGLVPNECELIHEQKLLRHLKAPIAAYLWVSFRRDLASWQRPLRLEMLLRLKQLPWCSET
ncbi:unnamed protein product [Durusdinium trenchii]|uniref:Ubiquitin-like domain-containing protein n=1 Tax=Durusdinium trenchii TaxID=1381693 RepID=A0ABP0KUA5_9DINO